MMAATPNYRGMFLRGYGSQSHAKSNGWKVGNTVTAHVSGGLGAIQGDATRNVYGTFNIYSFFPGNGSGEYTDNQLFERANVFNNHRIQMISGAANAMTGNVVLRNFNVVPTAAEIRPVNVAVRHLIRCR